MYLCCGGEPLADSDVIGKGADYSTTIINVHHQVIGGKGGMYSLDSHNHFICVSVMYLLKHGLICPISIISHLLVICDRVWISDPCHSVSHQQEL